MQVETYSERRLLLRSRKPSAARLSGIGGGRERAGSLTLRSNRPAQRNPPHLTRAYTHFARPAGVAVRRRPEGEGRARVRGKGRPTRPVSLRRVCQLPVATSVPRRLAAKRGAGRWDVLHPTQSSVMSETCLRHGRGAVAPCFNIRKTRGASRAPLPHLHPLGLTAARTSASSPSPRLRGEGGVRGSNLRSSEDPAPHPYPLPIARPWGEGYGDEPGAQSRDPGAAGADVSAWALSQIAMRANVFRDVTAVAAWRPG